MARKSYEYKWDGDTLIVRYKGSRGITARLGNAELYISPRTAPKKYSLVVTGNKNARKGLLPNSQSALYGRWGWLSDKINLEKKVFKDDFGFSSDVVVPKLNDGDSFNYKDEILKYDGATILDDDPVLKMFW